MSETEFTLNLLGSIMLDMREDIRDVRQRLTAIEEVRLPAIERTITQHQDELTVTTAMVMRHASEPIAWGAMQSEIRRLRERVEALETQDH
jgi:hypothetical protein